MDLLLVFSWGNKSFIPFSQNLTFNFDVYQLPHKFVRCCVWWRLLLPKEKFLEKNSSGKIVAKGIWRDNCCLWRVFFMLENCIWFFWSLFIIYYFNRIGFSGIFILHGDYSNEMECSSEIADVLFMAKEKFNRTENRPSAQ